jgi:hypothetical protein
VCSSDLTPFAGGRHARRAEKIEQVASRDSHQHN